METIGAYEAKTHFSAILAEVEKGKRITITRHGKPAARLEPVLHQALSTPEDIVREILRFSKEHRLDGLSLKELIDEGRR